jgi:hypothetical protein
MMLKKVILAAVALPLALSPAFAGGCNSYTMKEHTVAQTPVPTPEPVAATQTPVPADAVKVEVAQAPVATPAQPKTN